MGHWALGMGHGALGIGHWALIISPCPLVPLSPPISPCPLVSHPPLPSPSTPYFFHLGISITKLYFPFICLLIKSSKSPTCFDVRFFLLRTVKRISGGLVNQLVSVFSNLTSRKVRVLLRNAFLILASKRLCLTKDRKLKLRGITNIPGKREYPT